MKSEASSHQRVMLSIPLCEFQVVEEDFGFFANFTFLWKRENNKYLVDGLIKYETITKQDSL